MDAQVTPQHKVHIPYWLLSLCALVVLLLMATLAGRLKEDQNTATPQERSTNRLTDQPENPNTYFEQIGKTASDEAFVVKNWNVLGADVPTATTSARIYPLLSDVSPAQAQPLIERIAARAIAVEAQAGSYVASDGAVTVEMAADTGWFRLQSPGGMALPAVEGDLESAVLKYVETVFNEQTFLVKSYFTKRGESGVRYYELQRDWDVIGLPIVNLEELAPYAAKLSLMQWTQLPQPSWVSMIAPDDTIVYASDITTGRARLSGVNTITIGVRSGQIVSVESNMHFRDMGQAEQVDELVPGLEALTKVTRGRFDMFVAQEQPTSNESQEPRMLTSAVLTNARVLQARLMYVSAGSGHAQNALIPTHVFQGVATSDKGRTVHFLTTFPAPVHTEGNGVSGSTKQGD